LRVQKYFRYEWLSVAGPDEDPGCHQSYAFGYLLALGLYSRFQAQGQSAVPLCERLFAASEHAYPEKTFLQEGIDMRSRDTYDAGFDATKRKVDELESLMP